MNIKTRKFTILGLVILGLVIVLNSFPSQVVAQLLQQPNPRNTLVLDVAADCRTFVPGTNRGDNNMVSGKIFPGGTLPSGAASNDPTQPVNGVAPIGEWLNRTRQTFPFPPEVAAAYSSVPPYFGNLYYILDNVGTLTTDGYGIIDVNGTPTVLLSITGGIGGFRGATGDVHSVILGTNATGCPNGRNTFNIMPGSVRGRSIIE